MDILKRRNAVKDASEDWKTKWTPAVITYSQSLKAKVGKDSRSITVRVRIFASNNFCRFCECPPFANICVANITLGIYVYTMSDVI